MTFLSNLPKFGSQHAAVAANKDAQQEPVAFTNAKKVIDVLDFAKDWDDIKDIVVDGAPFHCQADALGECVSDSAWPSYFPN